MRGIHRHSRSDGAAKRRVEPQLTGNLAPAFQRGSAMQSKESADRRLANEGIGKEKTRWTSDLLLQQGGEVLSETLFEMVTSGLPPPLLWTEEKIQRQRGHAQRLSFNVLIRAETMDRTQLQRLTWFFCLTEGRETSSWTRRRQ